MKHNAALRLCSGPWVLRPCSGPWACRMADGLFTKPSKFASLSCWNVQGLTAWLQHRSTATLYNLALRASVLWKGERPLSLKPPVWRVQKNQHGIFLTWRTGLVLLKAISWVAIVSIISVGS